MTPLFEAIMKHVPGAGRRPRRPVPDAHQPARLLATTSARSASAASSAARSAANMPVAVIDREGKKRNGQGRCRCSASWASSASRSRKPRPATSSRSPASRTLDDFRHGLRAGHAGSAARADRGRADHQHDLPGQQLAVRRHKEGKFLTSRQLRERLHARDAAQRRAAGRGDGRSGQVHGLRPRRTAPRRC